MPNIKSNIWEDEDYLSDYTVEEEQDNKRGGFLSLDSLCKNTSQSEIDRIDKAIQTLTNTMARYIEDVIELWDKEFKPFIDSPDCRIFRSDIDPSNYKQFLDLMCEQKTFKFMIIAHNRLVTRRRYLSAHQR
jgi:hypothetical protein